MAERMIVERGFKEKGEHNGMRVFELGKMRMYETGTELVRADFAEELKEDVIYFVCSHFSAAGKPAMTTHPTGNWTANPMLGGKPKTLSTAAPLAMLCALRHISKVDAPNTDRVYEATHHGPTIDKPSLFIEFGGDEKTRQDKKGAMLAADAFYDSMVDYLDKKVEHSKVVVGIGGTHYPQKFTALALEKGYAFGHMMPKHSVSNANGDNLDMLDQAISRSQEKVEAAVIDWKSMGSPVRVSIIKRLNALGLDYERV